MTSYNIGIGGTGVLQLVGAPKFPRISRDSYDAARARGLSTAEALEVATGVVASFGCNEYLRILPNKNIAFEILLEMIMSYII